MPPMVDGSVALSVSVGRIAISDIISSPILDKLLGLKDENISEMEQKTNWFAAGSVVDVYGTRESSFLCAFFRVGERQGAWCMFDIIWLQVWFLIHHSSVCLSIMTQGNICTLTPIATACSARKSSRRLAVAG